jgi:hypothetical protein
VPFVTGDRRRYIRLNLARAYQLHWRLALGTSLAGIALAMAYIAMVQPQPVSEFISKSLPIMLGGTFLGLLAAVIANRLDPHIYIAADIEQLLGVSPSAVLPDFNEVSDEIKEEHLGHISRAIDQCQEAGELKNCVFTGLTPGAGVSQIVSHIYKSLSRSGRAVELVEVSANPLLNLRLSTAEDALLLVDAGTFPMSSKVEQMAHSIDCVCVIVESGVTTRAQLLAAARALRLLEANEVRFVLNRVALAKADPALRRFLNDMERYFRSRSISGLGISSSMWPVRSGKFGRVHTPKAESLPRLDVASDALRAESNPVQPIVPRTRPLVLVEWPKPVPPAPAAVPEPAPEPSVHTSQEASLEPVSRPSEQDDIGRSGAEKQTPVDIEAEREAAPATSPVIAKSEPPKAEAKTESEKPVPPKIAPPPLPAWFWQGPPGKASKHTAVVEADPEAASSAPEAPSRLSALRGAVFSLGINRR